LIKTPLGHISFPDDPKHQPAAFDLEVIDEAGKRTELKTQYASYIFPHKAIASSVDVETIVEEQQKLIKKQQDPSKLPDKYRKLNAVYGTWNTAQLLELADTENAKILINTYQIKAYGYLDILLSSGTSLMTL